LARRWRCTALDTGSTLTDMKPAQVHYPTRLISRAGVPEIPTIDGAELYSDSGLLSLAPSGLLSSPAGELSDRRNTLTRLFQNIVCSQQLGRIRIACLSSANELSGPPGITVHRVASSCTWRRYARMNFRNSSPNVKSCGCEYFLQRQGGHHVAGPLNNPLLAEAGQEEHAPSRLQNK